MKQEGYFIEYHQQGAYIKVTAIDPRTGTEVSIVGNPRASQDELNRIAVRKLEYVLERDKPKPLQGRGVEV